MKDSKNLILAVALSLLVMLSWQYFVELPKHKAQLASQESRKAEAVVQENSPGGGTVGQMKERAAAVSESSRIAIENGDLRGSIALKGARFDDLALVKYKETTEKNSPEVMLLSPSDTEDFYFGEFGWLGENAPDAVSIWQADGDKLQPGKSVTLTWKNPRGLVFKQVITLDDNYMFKVVQSVENKGTSAVSVMPYGLINRTHRKTKAYYILHEGPLGVMNGALEEVTYQKLIDAKKMEYKGTAGWLGITDKYWLTALIPQGPGDFDSHFTYSNKDNIDRFQVDYLGGKLEIAPGETKETSSYFFAGAKEVRLLDDYSQKLHIQLFDRAIDFGWFYFLTKRVFYILNFLNKSVGNFGVAIILLTLLVKLLMFPLANKSYKSMSRSRHSPSRSRSKTGAVKAGESRTTGYSLPFLCLDYLFRTLIFVIARRPTADAAIQNAARLDCFAFGSQ